MPGSTYSPRVARPWTACSLALALGLLLAGCEREADDATSALASEASSSRADALSSEPQTYEALAETRKALVGDAAQALDETYAALGMLAEKDFDGAADALARATGKLEVVVTADPELALVPVAVELRTHDLIATPGDVDALRKAAEEALDDGRLQEGRRLIEDLASEHVYSVTKLPLATYPGGLRQAAALIKSGRPLEAIETLEAALGTLVIEETIIPLPLVRAEHLLERARPAAEQAQRSPQEAARVRSLLAEARQQLDLAQALGYASRQELGGLYEALTEIEDKTQGQGSASGLFDRMKGLFDTAKRSANVGTARSTRPAAAIE
ncbi:YfdX family protein [Altererythrobacter sp. Root672]|uniref:YfdX family protein n=1 Tax=Altererythrobacter sp. Root672 TaxID=1736584 RepID=UPI0006F61949|nr:YfdX family protein [Altererythrobacter sp. Root672]KRA84006.1 hypothetical protein ASD76_08380 [Altererythrobacter sp. Root672]